jgi:hypothetical protein
VRDVREDGFDKLFVRVREVVGVTGGGMGMTEVVEGVKDETVDFVELVLVEELGDEEVDVTVDVDDEPAALEIPKVPEYCPSEVYITSRLITQSEETPHASSSILSGMVQL